MSSVGNERAKLIATYLNGIALILFGVGAVAPVAAYIDAASPPPHPGWILAWCQRLLWRSVSGTHLRSLPSPEIEVIDWGPLLWAFAPAPIDAIVVALFMLWHTPDDGKVERDQDRS